MASNDAFEADLLRHDRWYAFTDSIEEAVIALGGTPVAVLCIDPNGVVFDPDFPGDTPPWADRLVALLTPPSAQLDLFPDAS